MDFGIFNLMTLRDAAKPRREIIEETTALVQQAEEIGIDVAWFAEHHFSNYSMSPSPLMMASYMAGKTSKIDLGAAVLVLPLYHPMRVAQEVALLDIQSGGRARVGLGSGYQKHEFDRYGIHLDDRTERTLEYWEVLDQALNTGKVAFDGTFVKVPPTELALTPTRKIAPLYVTGNNPKILERAARSGAVIFMTAGYLGSQGLFGIYDRVCDGLGKLGVDPKTVKTGIQQYIHVTDDKDDALKAADCARYVARLVTALRQPETAVDGYMIREVPIPSEPDLETFRDNIIIGNAEYVAERMAAEIRRLNASHYNCFFQFGALPYEMAKNSLERFGKDVLPLLTKELGPLDKIGVPDRVAA
ncbi:LLM class flavin-dependent oxidoreductase [Acuticoccus mangrovi]|uniref:LLM class flavin-dependent oxidoreductase n=1 Tax=Acuticoccus mangrovi TaxID=2796142 RepID=A0A934MFL4_9HYPH|nr:LLM class flavin-dependent oxidoreductase [Acuticoccus mangrovi]MBJ3775603.1 LLM class flavin-dependent oxidoreductase [Acuticoccus mangrovi]